jgi:hypothetical protein
MPSEPTTTNCFVQSVLTFLGGGLGGIFLGHFLAIGRDSRNRKHANDLARRTRKTNLLAFLNVWSSEVERNVRVISPANVPLDIADQFDEKRLELIRQATPIESDFRADKLTRFKQSVDKITVMTAGQVGYEQGKKNLVEAIRTLVEFLKGN